MKTNYSSVNLVYESYLCKRCEKMETNFYRVYIIYNANGGVLSCGLVEGVLGVTLEVL